MFGIQRFLIGAAASIALLVAAFGAGYYNGHSAGVESTNAKWVKLKAEWEEASRAFERAMQKRGDALAEELEQERKKVRVQTVEVVRTVYRTASPTRPCFTPDVTAALNKAAPIVETVERPGSAPVVTEHRAQPEGGTSELAAAEWVANARAAHEECRAQVQKLGDWIRGLKGDTQ